MTANEIKRLRELEKALHGPHLDMALTISLTEHNFFEAAKKAIPALLDAAEEAASLRAERDRLRAALEGLEDRYEPGRFCDHAAAPCHRCDAAKAALAEKKDGGA